jgi:alpha-tubulin suppressor-like RCC1 family protein
LWAWGSNSFGQLGLGDDVTRSSVTQVGSLTSWASISAFGNASVFVRTNGSLWSCGQNNYGQLALGDTTYRSSPTQVGSLTNWSKIQGGEGHCLAIKTDGTLWSWGWNIYGQLGNGSQFDDKSSPIQIGALTNWSSLAAGRFHSLAIKTDKTMWAWGSDTYGQTTIADKSSPVQIGALSSWLSVSAGYYYSLAIRE